MKREQVWEFIGANWLPLLTVAAGIIAAAFQLFGVLSDTVTLSIILAILCLLATTEIVERVKRFDTLDSNLETGIERVLSVQRTKLHEIVLLLNGLGSGVSLMQGTNLIYARSIDILHNDTHNRLWISAFNLKGVPRHWFAALKKKLEANPEMECRRVVAVNDLEELELVERFLEDFKGCTNLLLAVYVKTPLMGTQDFFVSDEGIAGIGFPEKAGVGGLTSCIWITDEDAVKHLADWYVNRLWAQARRIKTLEGVNTEAVAEIKAELS